MIIKMPNIVLILSILLIAGCLYVPTHEMGESMITDEAMNFFVPNKTTRADVLLRFGDPAQRLEEDRFFIYHWVPVMGLFFIGSGGLVDQNPHYLCLEFTSENLLKRWKHFEEGYSQLHPEQQILEWIEGSSKP